MVTAITTTPVQMLAQLNMLDKLQGLKDRKITLLESFVNRTCSFDWIHLGTTNVKIGTLLSLFETTPHLLPPRTGHIGNWEQIARGRSRMMDFNKAICSQGYGYPLIYCFNQTESNDLQRGDSVYLPGSVIEQDERIELPLYTWNGKGFVEQSRENPLFTPFVQTKWDGKLIPLIQLHKNRMQKFQGMMNFRFESTVVQKHESSIKRILYELLDDARRHENPRSLHQDLISHQVTLDGRMYRADLICEGEGYRMGESTYSSLTELVEATMLPFQAVNEPEKFFSRIGSIPRSLPLISNVVMRIFSCIFGTHYPDTNIDRSLMTIPFNPHFHWGARDMGGYPPKRKGYFASRSKIRSYRRICDTIIDKFPEIDPIMIIMIPAVVFSLCPADVYEKDSHLLAKLFEQVKNATDHLSGEPDEMMLEVERVTGQWLSEARSSLSKYWMSRFTPKSGILNGEKVHDFSNPIEPDGFRELTFQQACMIVGVLMESAL